MIEQEGDFIPPPEAPVFRPTPEEFKDALGYIQKIRPIAEKSGICKIIPPSDWQPPFAVDVDTFRFTPRVQKLNELEAKTRTKLNFLDKLAKFWELQGSQLRIPNVERKHLDLYNLNKIVNEEGGYELCTRERKWSKIACRMGYAVGKNVGSMLRCHYEKTLYPYDIFMSGATVDPAKLSPQSPLKQEKDEPEVQVLEYTQNEYKPHGIADKEAEGKFTRKAYRRAAKEDPSIDYSSNPELKKLQFFGAGPKAAVPDKPSEVDSEKAKVKTRDKNSTVTYVDHYMCNTCGKGDGDENMLLCDGCDDAFHTYCLIPPIQDVPKGEWRCPKCVAKGFEKPNDEFGFDQSKVQYSLQTFGEKADQFKLDYFNKPVNMVPCETVEKEFWRLVNSIEEDVSVEYGADVHAIKVGSGFPMEHQAEQFKDDMEYVTSDWNLNNLAIRDKSILRHVNGDVSGMKVPWCYVGMCFSSFCWHIEDHWSYSINYNHWGEPKTWYGVPGSKAVLLEQCMKKNAPELFERSPDLLHHITTIMNPNVLMAYGVPIVRADQHAGEFMLTFPRAYHAGFNQGYNFAEAVNFCPADWIPIGRACIDHYRHLKRHCVFSHEELICKIAADPNRLDLNLAAAVHKDMLHIVDNEKKMRKTMLDKGVKNAWREQFELLQDDERQCCYCKTTCFLSAIVCNCKGKLVCLYHLDKLCDVCPASSFTLSYRYTLDELPAMLMKLKVRAESFDSWGFKVNRALEAAPDQKLDLVDLKELVQEAEDRNFPDSTLLTQLRRSVDDANKCAHVAQQLVSKKVRTRHLCRNRHSGETKYAAKLSLEELQCFIEQVNCLPCVIPDAKHVTELLTKVEEFQKNAQTVLGDEDLPSAQKIDELLDTSVTLDVDLPEIPLLKKALRQAQWLEKLGRATGEDSTITLELMGELLNESVNLAQHVAVEKALAELQHLHTVSERLEDRAKTVLATRPRLGQDALEQLIEEAEGVRAHLPQVRQLEDALHKAEEWGRRVEEVLTDEHYPYLDVLETIVNKGRTLPVKLERLALLESQVSAAKSWRERTARTFLKKNSPYTLVEVLSPRTDIGAVAAGKTRKRKNRDTPESKADRENDPVAILEFRSDEHQDPATIVAAFKAADARELEAMADLRARNLEKVTSESPDVRFCQCRKPGLEGLMIQCELCKDYFHSTCVPIQKLAHGTKGKAAQVQLVQAARELKFLCPLCLRSRRPRLETILSLLVSLQKLPVRLPEGEALQCLTERAMAWQDRARQALATAELSTALGKLSVMNQRLVEAQAREKTEKIISAELQKAASNPELQGHLQTVQQSAWRGQEDGAAAAPWREDAEARPEGGAVFPGQPEPMVMNGEDLAAAQLLADMATASAAGRQEQPDHAYSSASKENSPRKQARKSPLAARSCDPPVLELSETTKLQLENLMAEGDLLEVSLDETQHIWRILQACQPSNPDRLLNVQQMLEAGGVAGISGSPDREKKKRKQPAEVGPDGKIKKKKTKTKEVIDGMKRSQKDGGEKRRRKRKEAGEDSGTVPEDDCSAGKCLKPSGEVSWVQCDSCEKWFHLLCVGLGEDEVNDQDDYICYLCRGERAVLRPAPAAAAGPIVLKNGDRTPDSEEQDTPQVIEDEDDDDVVCQDDPMYQQTPVNNHVTSIECS